MTIYTRCSHCLLTQGMHSPNCPAHPDSWAEYAPYDAPTPRRLDVVMPEPDELAALAQRLGMRLIPLADGVTLIIAGGKDGR